MGGKDMNKMHLLPIQDIKVSDKFLKSVPNEGKINRYRDAYLLANESKNSFYHCSGQVKPIVIDSHNVIVDGYIQYLIMKEMNENYCYCIYREVCKPYMLIQGIHNIVSEKEYTWKVPRSKKWNEFLHNVSYGDQILCNTIRGVVPVIVTNISVAMASKSDLSNIKNVASTKITKGKIWNNIKIDKKVLYKNGICDEWQKAYYAGCTYDGKPMVWADGNTSWTAIGTEIPKYVRLFDN